MIAATIGPASGAFPDIAADPLGWVMPWQDLAHGDLELSQLDPDGEKRVPDVRIPAGGGLAFARVWVDPVTKHTWLAWRHEQIGGIVLNVTTGAQKFLGWVHGNCPVALGGGVVWYQADAAYALRWRALADLETEHRPNRAGRPTGIAWVTAAGDPVLVDDARLSVPGLVNPQRAGRCVVGENGDDGPARNVARLDDGREASLWPGHFSRTPRIATDGHAYAVVTSGGPGVRWMSLTDPPDFREPVVQPPPPPDIPWQTDPTRTVDLEPFIDAASTARKDLGDGRWLWWLRKSDERLQFGDDIIRGGWGEWWKASRSENRIGLHEDRSTAYRMVSRRRPKTHAHTNTERDRISPEEVVAANARGENLGDPHTLPLASYTLEGDSLWLPLTFTGRFELTYRTRYRWWDLPEFGGTWEAWDGLRVTITLEAGYGRFNGLEVFCRQRYLRNDGKYEWNYLGPSGWSRHEAYHADGTLEFVSPGTGPAAKGPFFTSRFVPEFPILRGTPKPPPPPPPPETDVPTYPELRNLEGRLEDTYQHHGKHPARQVTTHVNEGGEVWREHYFARRHAGMDHEAAMRSIESEIDRIEGRPDRWATTPVEPGPGGGNPPIAGRLRVDRGRLRNDAGWFQFQGISEFDAIHLARTGQRGEVTRRFRRAARHGRNAVRVLGMARNLFDLHPGQAGYDDAVAFVLDLAEQLGLYVLFTVFADAQLVMPDHGDRSRHLEAFARRHARDPRILWTIANEARKNGWNEADDTRILELADLLAGVLGHRDFGISDPLDGDDEHATAEMLERFRALGRRSNILLLHGSRKEDGSRVRWVEHLKGLRDIVDAISGDVGRPLYGLHEEPMGAAASSEPGRRDHRAAAHVAGACTAAVLGLGYVYHYIATQSDAVPGLAEAAIAARIPAAPEFRYTNANLGGSWVGPVGAWSKIRPAHDGAQAWAVGIGFSPGPLNVQGGWRVAETVTIESEGVHCHVWRGERA